jgi:hypothetical protein
VQRCASILFTITQPTCCNVTRRNPTERLYTHTIEPCTNTHSQTHQHTNTQSHKHTITQTHMHTHANTPTRNHTSTKSRKHTCTQHTYVSTHIHSERITTITRNHKYMHHRHLAGTDYIVNNIELCKQMDTHTGIHICTSTSETYIVPNVEVGPSSN